MYPVTYSVNSLKRDFVGTKENLVLNFTGTNATSKEVNRVVELFFGVAIHDGSISLPSGKELPFSIEEYPYLGVFSGGYASGRGRRPNTRYYTIIDMSRFVEDLESDPYFKILNTKLSVFQEELL